MNNSWGMVAHVQVDIKPIHLSHPGPQPCFMACRPVKEEEALGEFLGSSQRQLIHPFLCRGFTLKPNDGRQRGCPLCPHGEGAVLA